MAYEIRGPGEGLTESAPSWREGLLLSQEVENCLYKKNTKIAEYSVNNGRVLAVFSSYARQRFYA